MREHDLDALLERCAEEPIHVPEAVQPHGAVVLVDRAGIVRARSARAHLVVGAELGLGMPVPAPLARVTGADVRSDGSPIEVRSRDGRVLDVVAHPAADGSLLDVEPADAPALDADALIARQRPLWSSRTLTGLVDALVAEVQALTGFDRVMCYRFDEEWNGEVVAESLAAGLRPYLGLRFPASDIPAQARELYRRNPARLIADVDYVPVPLEHQDPTVTAPLDLSASGVRSVSPVHLEYLRNMGVAASMSLSLLVAGELWGLVACHHLSGPLRPDPRRRRAAAALAELASALIVEVTDAELLADRVLAAEQVGVVRSTVESADDPHAALLACAELTGVVGAEGVVVCIDGRLGGAGEIPPLAEAARDASALLDGDEPVATDALPDPGGARVGAMVAPLSGSDEGWLLWYRPELVREIQWAGDPRSDEVAADADGRAVLGPRRSFDTFVEVVSGRSRPWGDAERWAAAELAEQVGSALARRTRQRLASAFVVQRALLLDSEVSAPGVDVAVRYVPADDDPIGGDWHDVVLLPGGATAFVVGDTAGHGLEVAGAMAQLRHALRAYLVGSPSPGGALGRLDELVRQLLPGEMATAVVCVLDPTTGLLSTSCAGHLPPLRLGKRVPQLLEVPGSPALGLTSPDEDGPRPEVTTPLVAGEGLVLFSDGLVERRGTPVPEVVAELARALGGGEPSSAAAAVCEQALAIVEAPASDDVTVLACRWPGAGRKSSER